MQLNREQEQVAQHLHGRLLALAGPGSGKTRTLTERTGRLIRRGIEPASILCITFTNKARDEMRERIAAAHGQRAEKVFISNFHGLCGMMLRRLGEPFGYGPRMSICDADDQMDLILQLARRRGMELTKPQARGLAILVNDWREGLGGERDLETRADDRFKAGELGVVRSYVDFLRRRNLCDFSGLLSESVRLLHEHGDIRKRLQDRFHFIQVDEYQDTNRAQNEIVELLAGKQDNVLAVGDLDQSIYEWRGASPDAIPQFIRNGETKTGRCTIVKLGANYRSSPQIIETADKLIRHAASRIAVEFSSTRPAGEPAKCAALETPQHEAEAIAANMENLVRAGTPLREMAVFYRTNDMSRPIEQALAKRRIAYQVVGSGSYYDRMEVRDVLAMLRFVWNVRDGISFARIANKPARGMGDALIGKLEAYAEKHDLDLLTAMDDSHLLRIRDEHGKPLTDTALQACQHALRIFGMQVDGRSVAAVVNDLLDHTGYDQWLKDRYEDKGEYEDRRRNINELVNSIAEYSRANPKASVGDYLESISLYTDGDEAQSENAVRLMSLHASKGLEFDVVYVVGAEHGLLPHEKALTDRGDKGLEEERRLCYVGFTRARKLLRVTWCRKRQSAAYRSTSSTPRPTVPSRFLVEAGLMSADEYATFAPAPSIAPRRPAPRAKARARRH